MKIVNRLDNLVDVILYFSNGEKSFPIMSYTDDKLAKVKASGDNLGEIYIDRLNSDITYYLSKAEKEKRSLCFYPNGSSKALGISEIKYHFVDIDVGDKEKQFERIMSGPLQPTLVYRGRAGHKFMFRVKEALWDKTSPELFNQSVNHFKNIQQQLVEYYEGDGNLLTPNYPLRLPYTKNYKYWREEIVSEHIVFFEPTNIYTQEELSKAFPPSMKTNEMKLSETYEGYSEEVQQIFKEFTDSLDKNDLTFTDYGDRVSFQCPIHEDSSPSAFMYKETLVVHCSKGRADGGCKIENGKHLRWVAEHLGWEDLLDLCNELKRMREEKYHSSINLENMMKQELVHINKSSSDEKLVLGILDDINNVLSLRDITVDSKIELVYQNIIEHALSDARATICIPLPPGGGKSTLKVALLKHLLKQDFQKAGAIIVVERVETARKLVAELGHYEIELSGPAFDVPHWKKSKAAFVMESAFTATECKKKFLEYFHGLCRGCSEVKTCLIPRKQQIQKEFPIVILTHTRLTMDKDRLSDYYEWKGIDGKMYKRKLLIIDEKPPLLDIKKLSVSVLDDFLIDFESFYYSTEAIREVQNLVERIKLIIGNVADSEIIDPVDPMFAFENKSEWYKRYHGNNVDIINQIEHLFRYGGRIFVDHTGNRSVMIYKAIEYDFEDFNTVVLDGTSSVDMDYLVNNDFGILDVPKLRCYANLTFHFASKSLNKNAYRKDPSNLVKLSNHIKTIAESDKTFVLCYKEQRGGLEGLLKEEITKGKVKINHFGNVKGSNDYADCTAMVFAGVQHKGDPYYIAKQEIINNQQLSYETNTINRVRRFKELEIERIKLNDQLVDIIQDICRVRIRNKNALEAIKVFIPTNDQVFINLLLEYFNSAQQTEWSFEEKVLPEWYNTLDAVLSALDKGETIKKKEVREKLQLVRGAGKKTFQRLQKDVLYTELLKSYNIAEKNKQTLIKL